MRIVIVGGVAAGVSAATRAKRLLGEKAEVVLFERGDRISFANCALPYYAGGVIRPEALYAAKAERLEALYGIDIREREEVLSINRAAKQILAKNLATGEEYSLAYDKLVLATGAEPRMLPIPGLKEFAHPLWRPEDALRLEKRLSEHPGLVVGIIGGGAVGVETAENVVRRGGIVHLMENGTTVMGRNDQGLSNAFLRSASSEKRLIIHLSDSAAKVEAGAGGRLLVTLQSGRTIEIDDLISAAGVQPRSKLAADAGLELGARGTILADRFMRTSDPDIYAVGDVATSWDPVKQDERPMMLAGTAVKEARACADALAGLNRAPMAGGFGTNGVSLFGMLWTTTGRHEQMLVNEGLVPHRDFFRATVLSRSHASWYPGSAELVLKLLFDAKGRILGAQALGRDGADKRIDVISAAMRFGATAADLAELDLCYCPQTGAPKDPVNIAGHLALNVLDGLVRFIEPQELRDLMAGKAPYLGEGVDTTGPATILDVREDEELSSDSLEWPLLHIPSGEVRERLDEVPADRLTVVVCRAGVRAYAAARALMTDGRRRAPIFVLAGGMRYYRMTEPLV